MNKEYNNEAMADYFSRPSATVTPEWMAVQRDTMTMGIIQPKRAAQCVNRFMRANGYAFFNTRVA